VEIAKGSAPEKMKNNPTKKPARNKPCVGCGGSGQTPYFGGESRFMFTWEDCPDCCGTGVDLWEDLLPDNSTLGQSRNQ
jgi:DnaJ-class molecular chaperone